MKYQKKGKWYHRKNNAFYNRFKRVCLSTKKETHISLNNTNTKKCIENQTEPTRQNNT